MQTAQDSREGQAAERARKEKLAAARAKYRKPFATEIRKARETSPSIVLADIERRTIEAQNGNRPILIRVKK